MGKSINDIDKNNADLTGGINMHAKEIEEIISEYLKNESAEYAIMIDGEWGSGKTYFLTHSLVDVIENIEGGKWEKKKCAYISLYGLNTIDEVAKSIWLQCIGNNNFENKQTTSKVLRTAGNFLTAALSVANVDLTKVAEFVSTLEVNDWIICFDDLERSNISLNVILGYMNQLVEHNKCKMIILANEKEIGKMVDREESEKILYRTIREKVIGVTIRFEPQMEIVFDSIIAEQYKADTGVRRYLKENKKEILTFLDSRGCRNIRTLKRAIGSIDRLYSAMEKNNYTSDSYFKTIMDSFVQYIIYLTVYIRNGNDVKNLGLTTSIGYVKFEKNGYGSNIRAYKFLEKYCTTMSFKAEELIEVVATLRKEYKEQEKIEEKQREKSAVAYGKLQSWYLLEDNEVEQLILLLWDEVKQNKYFCVRYQEIIGLLIILESVGFAVGDFDELLQIMNKNIEQADEIKEMNRRSYSFKDEPELQDKYDRYVNELTVISDSRKQEIQIDKLAEKLDAEDWFFSLNAYCVEHQNDFIMRNGFIDLIKINSLLQKIKLASVNELRCLEDTLDVVYRAENIKDFFMNDKEQLVQIQSEINKMTFEGINKPLAQKELLRCLEKILEKL